MHRFKDLEVWKVSIEMVGDVYEITSCFPKHEMFGIINQIRRSAVSIPSNIAEGAGKGTNKDFKKYVAIASGSCNELETQLIISNKLDYISEVDFTMIKEKLTRIQNMLFGLQRSLRNT